MNRVTLHNYTSHKEVIRNKFFLQQNLINLLETGEKKVYYSNKSATITSDQIIILSSGNCLMTEKLAADNTYHSTMLLADNAAFTNFFREV